MNKLLPLRPGDHVYLRNSDRLRGVVRDPRTADGLVLVEFRYGVFTHRRENLRKAKP